jgi:hypothetical protein
LEKAQEKRCLLNKIRKKQSTFVRHIMRCGKIEKKKSKKRLGRIN